MSAPVEACDEEPSATTDAPTADVALTAAAILLIAVAVLNYVSYDHSAEYVSALDDLGKRLHIAVKLLAGTAVPLSLGGGMLYSVTHAITKKLQHGPLWRGAIMKQSTRSIYKFLSTALMAVVWIVACYALLDRAVANNELSHYITMDTIVSLALGLAVRPLVGNVIDGFVIVLSGHVSLGDVISVPGTTWSAEVVDLGLLGVQVCTPAESVEGEAAQLHQCIHIPFSLLQSGTITRHVRSLHVKAAK